MSIPDPIGVIGGGAWGTALAQTVAASGPVTLWARSAEVVDTINASHANPAYLPGITLSPAIHATAAASSRPAAEPPPTRRAVIGAR